MKIVDILTKFIFKRKQKNKYKVILKIIKEAKKEYQDEPLGGLCSVLLKSIKRNAKELEDGLSEKILFYDEIPKYIPEFNIEFFGIKNNHDYWWPIEDKISRIEALNKLIHVYKQKIKSM
jgi:hypothetical protein